MLTICQTTAVSSIKGHIESVFAVLPSVKKQGSHFLGYVMINLLLQHKKGTKLH